MQTYIVIPAYNEAPGIAATVDAVKARVGPLARIVVVDDGSTDGTEKILDDLAAAETISLVRHDRNLGVRAAFESGFRVVLATATPDAAIVTMEADGTSDVELLPRMLAAIAKSETDVVIASRSARGGSWLGFPPHRTVLSRGCNRLLRLGLGIRDVTDYTIFFRAYRAHRLQQALDRIGETGPDDFAYNAYLLMGFAADTRFAEIPLVYDYRLKRSDSKLKPGRTIVSYFKMLASTNRWRPLGPNR